MLGSSILDVAIGMAFLYLLLSLIASAAQEILASLIQARAANLERGIRSLFSNDNISADETFFAALYNHGLVRGLYQTPSKDYVENRFRNWTRTVFGKIRLGLRFLLGMKVPGTDGDVDHLLLPAYISSRVFALAMRDLLSRVPPGDTQAAKQGGVGSDASRDGEPSPGVEEVTVTAAAEALRTAVPVATASSTVDRSASDASVSDSIQAHRQMVKNLEVLVSGVTKGGCAKNLAAEALLALVKDARGDEKRLQENIENWYNDTMDRVSGWYKRYTQSVLLVIGLVLAVSFNVDSVRLARTLWVDKDARASLIAAATEYTKSHSSAPAAGPATSNDPDGDRLTNNLRNTVHAFDTVGEEALLPVGWRRSSVSEYWTTYVLHGQGNRSHMWAVLLGWILTAVALSYGAPFWFDTLNKFMVVRSTVKPQEKSRSEGSKD